MLCSLTRYGFYRGYSAAATNQMALIKELREKSQAPISDVKKALVDSNWDVDKAFEFLRKKGLAAAVKKASRVAAEGLVGLARSADGRVAAVVEINSETDFVARNDAFQKLVGRVATAALSLSDKAAAAAPPPSYQVPDAALQELRLEDGTRAADAVTELAGVIRENIRLRRAFILTRPDPSGVLATYLHSSPAAGVGRIASLVAFESATPSAAGAVPSPAAEELGQRIAMQVVAMKPRFLDRASVPGEVMEKEREILKAQVAASGKPPAVLEKMVQGRLGKFYEEACLVDQPFVLDEKSTVAKIAKASGLKATGFIRVQVGEGLEQTDKADFASEVAELAKGGKKSGD